MTLTREHAVNLYFFILAIIGTVLVLIGLVGTSHDAIGKCDSFRAVMWSGIALLAFAGISLNVIRCIYVSITPESPVIA